MTVDTMSQPEQSDSKNDDAARRQRRKNYALLTVLFAWVVIIYLVAILRIGGGS